MIAKPLAGALIAGSLAIGLAIGAAGTIIANGTTPASAAAACADHMADMTAMINSQMMSGHNEMMSGQKGMMSGQKG